MTTTHKTTHTPGPWNAGAYTNPKYTAIWGGGAKVPAAAGLRLVATLKGDEAPANARLIAAAPTMFDALKEIEGGLEDLAIHLNTTSMDRYIKQARAIIERIEGQE